MQLVENICVTSPYQHKLHYNYIIDTFVRTFSSLAPRALASSSLSISTCQVKFTCLASTKELALLVQEDLTC
jgi:hypothetical protein